MPECSPEELYVQAVIQWGAESPVNSEVPGSDHGLIFIHGEDLWI